MGLSLKLVLPICRAAMGTRQGAGERDLRMMGRQRDTSAFPKSMEETIQAQVVKKESWSGCEDEHAKVGGRSELKAERDGKGLRG